MKRYEYIIVGGGIVGVCAAYYLAQAGKQVLLIERRTLAPPTPYSSSGEAVKMFRTVYGNDPRLTQMTMAALDWWRRFENESGTELMVPAMWLIFDAENPEIQKNWPAYAMPPMSFARESVEVMRAAKLPFEWLSKEAILERFIKVADNPMFDCGLLDKSVQLLSAEKAVRAIGRLAQLAGAEIWEETTVEQVVRSDGRVRCIETSRESVEPVAAVIFAAGYMNAAFVPELRAKTRVTREQLVVVRPDNPDDYLPDRFPGTGHYVFPLHGDGVTKIFAGEDPNSKVVDPAATDLARLYAHGADDDYIADTRSIVGQWVPDIANAPIETTKTCFYTSTRNGRYLIDRRGNAVVVSACSGTGFKHGPISGLVASELAMGRDATWYLDEFRYENHVDW